MNCCNSGIRYEHDGKITYLFLWEPKCAIVWEFQISIDDFYYALDFVMVIFKVGLRNEEVD